jgi:EmrB/QacA subfamily drug resistance transporter
VTDVPDATVDLEEDGPLAELAHIEAAAAHLPSRRWWALGVIAIAQLMVVLDATVVNIALPRAQLALHISDADRQWVITAYTLAFGGLLLLGGRIADYLGRKKLFIIGLIGFAAASALGGAAENGQMLFAARAVQGAFAAVLAPASLALLAVTFTESKERARAFAVYGAISGGGAAIGLILGGVLTQYASWRWCLLVNVPIAIAAAIAGWLLVTESKAERGSKYDIPGAVLVTAGLVSLVYGFTEAAKAGVGWVSVEAIGYLGLAVVLLVAFVIVELRSRQPLLPLRIILDRNRGGAYLASGLIASGVFSMFLFLTYFFQLNLGYSPLKSGFAFLPFSAGIIFSAIGVSILLPRVGPKPLMLTGTVMGTLGLASFTFLSDSSSWLGGVLPGEVLLSVGLAGVFVPLSSVGLAGVGKNDAGVASAVLNATQQVGGSLGTALLNTFYASAVASYLASHPNLSPTAAAPLAAIEGYHVAFWIGVGMLVAAFIVVMLIINAGRDDVDLSPEAMHGF